MSCQKWKYLNNKITKCDVSQQTILFGIFFIFSHSEGFSECAHATDWVQCLQRRWGNTSLVAEDKQQKVKKWNWAFRWTSMNRDEVHGDEEWSGTHQAAATSRAWPPCLEAYRRWKPRRTRHPSARRGRLWPWSNPSPRSLSAGRRRSSAEALQHRGVNMSQSRSQEVPQLCGKHGRAWTYLCHARPAAPSHTGRPCTGHQGWVCQPSSPAPASPGLEREDPARPGCSGSRPCWMGARAGSRGGAASGLRTAGRWGDGRERGRLLCLLVFLFFNTWQYRDAP